MNDLFKNSPPPPRLSQSPQNQPISNVPSTSSSMTHEESGLEQQNQTQKQNFASSPVSAKPPRTTKRGNSMGQGKILRSEK